MHIYHGSMGHGYWPMAHVTHPDLLTHLAHDPWGVWPNDPLSALTLRSLALAREFGASIVPQRVGPLYCRTQTPQISHRNWGYRINKHINFMKICMIFVPLFSQDTPMEWMLLRVRWFSFFRKSSQPETKQICHPFTWPQSACLLHLRNKLCQPAWRQTRSGGSHYKAWLAEDSLTGCRAARCREELQSKRSQSCKQNNH